MINWRKVDKFMEETGRSQEEYFYMLEAIAEEKAKERRNKEKDKKEEYKNENEN